MAIRERGETPFLHALADNLGAISPCGRFGFATRWQPLLMVLERTAPRGKS